MKVRIVPALFTMIFSIVCEVFNRKTTAKEAFMKPLMYKCFVTLLVTQFQKKLCILCERTLCYEGV